MGQYSKKHGVWRRLITTILYIALIGQIHAQEKEVRVALCYDSTSFINPEYQTAISKSINRVVSNIDSELKPKIRFRSCLSIPPFSFYGSEEAIFGREEAMAAMIESAYWLAASEALNYNLGNSKQAIIENCGNLDWIDIYRLAKAKLYFEYENIDQLLIKIQNNSDLKSKYIKQLSKLVEKLHYHENEFSDFSEEDEVFELALTIYRAIVDHATAFFLGHEMYHYNGDSFFINKPSKIEELKNFTKLTNLQLIPKRLFDPNLVQADKQEILADLSGYRALQTVDARIQIKINDPLLLTLIRKLSIDLVAFPFLIGFDLFELELNEAPEFILHKSYLYPELRLLLYCDVLNKNESNNTWALKICNNTAKAIVTIIQTHVSQYDDSNGDVPDEILNLLPDGVEEGWSTNYWDDNSFKCRK